MKTEARALCGLGFCIDIKNVGSVFWGYQYNGLWFLVSTGGIWSGYYCGDGGSY